MPLPERVLNPARYRKIDFRPGKILQSREMNLLQNIERYIPGLSERLAKYDLDALFAEGALLNATVEVVNGNQVRISRTNPSVPILVFVAGAFEPIDTTQTLTFVPKGDGSPDYVYVNWVMWRVSGDALDVNALHDPTLTDQESGETTANVGQIAVWLSTANEAAPVEDTMYARNTPDLPPIRCISLVWNSGSLRLTSVSRFLGTVNATESALGMVRLSAPGTNVAAADTDPRLSDARTPLPGSVDTDSLRNVVLSTSASQIPYTDETGASAYDNVSTVISGGVSSDRVVFSSWTAVLTDVLDRILGRIGRLFSVVKSLTDRVSAIEQRPTVDLGAHATLPLGVPNSHPPRSSVPYEALTDGSNTSYAFSVLNSQNPNLLYSAIQGDGDFKLYGQAYNDLLTFFGTQPVDLRSMASLARFVRDKIQELSANAGSGGGSTPAPVTLSGDVSGPAASTSVDRVKGRAVNFPASVPADKMVVLTTGNMLDVRDIPTAGTGSVTLGGDVTGPSGSNTVGRIRGVEVATAAPAVGDVLTFLNGKWTPNAFSVNPQFLSFSVEATRGGAPIYAGNWTGFKIGNMQILYCSGDFKNGDIIYPPRDNPANPSSPKSWGSMQHTISLSVISFSLSETTSSSAGRVQTVLQQQGLPSSPVEVRINATGAFMNQDLFANVGILCIKTV